jgi:hypothetical protein
MQVNKSSHNYLGVSYTQNDLDMIRQQIIQTEATKRRSMVVALMITIAALTGAIILLSSFYGMYIAGESDKNRLAQENASLKSRADQAQKQLDEIAAKEAAATKLRSEAQSRLQSLLPAVLNSSASSADVSNFARMVYGLPQGRIELDRQPPNNLFRNWRAGGDSATEIYTLVGGFADGKWVVYSNLIAKR